MDFNSRIEKEFLPFVNKPGRYTGNEYNVIIKSPEAVNFRIALAFPEVYEIGMSYGGFDILYHVLNSKDDVWAERVYAPWFDAEAVLREKEIPLFSLESRTPLAQFDALGFTLQYELTYTNILNMLDLGGIPIYAADRREDDPLIIGGGPSTSNPEPVAPFFDLFLIGDGEEAVTELARILTAAKAQSWTREEKLKQLAKITGVYVPSFYSPQLDEFGELLGMQTVDEKYPKKVSKRIVPELKSEYYPGKPLVPLIEITHDRIAMEIMRGCTEGCRFCNAGMIYRPLRQRAVDDILTQTRRSIQNSGFNEVSLLSLNSSDYQDLEWLMVKEKMLLSESQVRFALPSLRLDAITPQMVDFVKTVKKTGFTFAPEAGSQRLRNVINKNITEDDIFKTLRLILDNGWQTVKFYFMIGLPTEKDEDIYAIVELIKKALDIAKNYKNVRFNISVSPFSPKPHTPFQWEKQDSPADVDRKNGILQDNLRHRNVNLTWRDGYGTSLETVLIRGNRELAAVIEEAWRLGSRFEGWAEGFNWNTWIKAFETHSVEWRKYLRPISISANLPWDHIDMGVGKSFLKQEKMNSLDGKLSKDCKDYSCLGCGLQRKEFENLVSCYKPDQQKQKKVSAATVVEDSATKTEEKPRISYGRGAKRVKTNTQTVKKKIRIQYTKTNLARFISHLDIVRLFDRACRRANIPLAYSQGFNPRPKIAFGPPLGLGVASIAEYMDMESLIGREADIMPKLNAVLPKGIEIVAQKTIFAKATALSAAINLTRYQTFLEKFDLPEEWINDFLEKDEILIQRTVKGELKEINIRPYVNEMKIDNGLLKIEIGRIEARTARIAEVLENLFLGRDVDYRQFMTQRSGQFISDELGIRTPLDVL